MGIPHVMSNSSPHFSSSCSECSIVKKNKKKLEFTYGSLSSTRMMVHYDCMQLLDDCRSDTQEFHTGTSV